MYQAFPIYYDMVLANICFQRSDKELCLRHLESINFRVRQFLMVFYQNLTESRVSHSVWLSYVQGFQGWGVGRMTDGEYVKYNGFSGNHVLFFQALDAFLGMIAISPIRIWKDTFPSTRENCASRSKRTVSATSWTGKGRCD